MSDRMLAVGCSLTHGQGNVAEYYHLGNIPNSFPNLIADRLGIACNNISWPGASNEMIFHRTVAELTTNIYSHCLVGWTSPGRNGWENSDEVYTFNVNYGKYEHKGTPLDDVFVSDRNNIKCVTNIEDKLPEVEKLQQALIVKAITDDENSKLKDYQISIRSICRDKNIHLVEINAMENDPDSELYQLDPKLFYNPLGADRHPPTSSYQFWAKDIFEKFYERT